jgi:hypothetical protein
MAVGCLWVIVLAAVAWGGLAISGGPVSTAHPDLTPAGSVSWRYDGTPPMLDPVVTRPVVTRHGIVIAHARGSDAQSGVARQSCNGDRALSTRRLGWHTVTCVVRDRAGNAAAASVAYLVVERLPHRG